MKLAEVEINDLSRERLDRRVPHREKMQVEVGTWQVGRNESTTPVNWRFGTADTRVKLKSLFPSTQRWNCTGAKPPKTRSQPCAHPLTAPAVMPLTM